MRADLASLFAGSAEVVEAIAGPDAAFGDALRRMLSTLVAFDHMVVFGYRGDERPVDLYDTFDPVDYVVFVSKYQDGPYRFDPFYHAARAAEPGFWRMRELAPDRFFSSEYFRSYYVETGLAEEVGYFVPVGPDVGVVLSLMRRGGSGVFPARAIDRLKATEPFVAALVRRRWADLASHFDRADATSAARGRAARAAPSVWADLALTAREAAVIDLVLQGHSSESIARRLGIANGTVKVHRRNVYRKLGISSQTQLLSLYLERVAGGW